MKDLSGEMGVGEKGMCRRAAMPPFKRSSRQSPGLARRLLTNHDSRLLYLVSIQSLYRHGTQICFLNSISLIYIINFEFFFSLQ